jgi:hypothetical protein
MQQFYDTIQAQNSTPQYAKLSSSPRENAAPASPLQSKSIMTKYDDYGIPVAYSEPESLTHQAWRLARAFYTYRIRPVIIGRYIAFRRGDWSFKQLFSLVNVLIVLWWVVLYWGERGTFNSAIDSCSWNSWERWVCIKTRYQMTGLEG